MTETQYTSRIEAIEDYSDILKRIENKEKELSELNRSYQARFKELSKKKRELMRTIDELSDVQFQLETKVSGLRSDPDYFKTLARKHLVEIMLFGPFNKSGCMITCPTTERKFLNGRVLNFAEICRIITDVTYWRISSRHQLLTTETIKFFYYAHTDQLSEKDLKDLFMLTNIYEKTINRPIKKIEVRERDPLKRMIAKTVHQQGNPFTVRNLIKAHEYRRLTTRGLSIPKFTPKEAVDCMLEWNKTLRPSFQWTPFPFSADLDPQDSMWVLYENPGG